jgi:hypothetical protein
MPSSKAEVERTKNFKLTGGGAQRFGSEGRASILKLENVSCERISVIDLNHYMRYIIKVY